MRHLHEVILTITLHILRCQYQTPQVVETLQDSPPQIGACAVALVGKQIVMRLPLAQQISLMVPFVPRIDRCHRQQFGIGTYDRGVEAHRYYRTW